MTIDRIIGIASLVEGALGIVITVLVAGKARQIQAAFDDRGRLGEHEYGNRREEPTGQRQTAVSEIRTEVRYEVRTATGPEGGNNSAGLFLAAGLVALLVLTVVALWLVQHQVVILRCVAVAAIFVTFAAVAGVVFRYRASRLISVRWPVLLILTDTLIAWAPRLITEPPFVDHRYDNLSTFIPANGDLGSRIAFLKRTYGLGLVAHVIEQNIGVALAICIATVAAFMSWRARPLRSAAPSVALVVGLVLALVMTSGAFSALYSRLGQKRTWTVSDASGAQGQFVGQAPPVAIERGKNGVLELLVARCGQERILDFSISGAPAASLNFGQGEIATLRLPSATAGMRIAISSTRYYRSQVIFKYLPRSGEFVSCRPGVTHADFVSPDFAC